MNQRQEEKWFGDWFGSITGFGLRYLNSDRDPDQIKA